MARVNEITQFLPATHTTILTLLRISIHQTAPPERDGTHHITYYSIIDYGRMKGWVGLIAWPIADGLPT